MFRKLFLAFIVLIISVQIMSAQSPQFEFAGQFGALKNDAGTDITGDSYGNVYLIGSFQDSTDLDIGESTDKKYSAGDLDFFIVKYSQTGDYIWGATFGGSNADLANSLVIVGDTMLILTGSFNSTVDFNPEQEIFNLTSTAMTDIFVLKLRTNGTFIDAWSVGGISAENSKEITADDENFYICGEFYSTFDFDPTENEYFKTSVDGKDMFVAKYNILTDNCLWVFSENNGTVEKMNSITTDQNSTIYATGNYYGTTSIYKFNEQGNPVWKKMLLGNFGGESEGISLKFYEKNLFITGNFEYNVDFDPSDNEYILTAGSSSRDIFVCKLSENGDFNSAYKIFGTSYDRSSKLYFDKQGNYYLTGTFSGTADFDPSEEAVYELHSAANDIFIAKYSNDNLFRWAFNIAGYTYNQGNSIFVHDNMLFATGYFYYNNDFDPSENSTTLTTSGLNNNDAFLAKYTLCQNDITTLESEICEGETLFFGNEYIGTSGIYFDTIPVLPDCYSVTILQLSVNPLPQTPLMPAGNQMLCQNPGFQFYTTTQAEFAVDYNWNISPPEAGSISAIGTQAEILFDSEFIGDAQITVQSINDCGISDFSDALNVNIDICPGFEKITEHIRAYPNPATEFVYIEYEQYGTVYIYDLLGQLQIISKQSVIDISELKTGVYFIRTAHGNFIQKFVKQ